MKSAARGIRTKIHKFIHTKLNIVNSLVEEVNESVAFKLLSGCLKHEDLHPLLQSAFLHPDWIPVDLVFDKYSVKDGSAYAILKALADLSLISLNISENFFSVHRLVLKVALIQMKVSERGLVFREVEDRLEEMCNPYFEFELVTAKGADEVRKLLNHVDSILAFHSQGDLGFKPSEIALYHLKIRRAHLLRLTLNYTEALATLKSIPRDSLQGPELAHCLNGLARTLGDMVWFFKF